MIPRIENIPPKKVIGKHIRMTLANNKTFELFRSFMPRRKEIKNNINSDLLCIQIYDNFLSLDDFSIDTEHEKWAAVEVSDFNSIPEGMELFTLVAGLYAVFLYKGNLNDFAETFQYIFGMWLPDSEYELDNRPHFEILGEKYKNNDPESEEEVWIPIKLKV